MNWSTQKAAEVERLLSTDATQGLTEKIAAFRLKEEGKNFLDPALDVTLTSCLKKLFFDVAHLPILCAIIMSFSYQSFFFGLLSLLIWGAFMLAYVFFYWRAKRRIARAAMMSLAPIKVLREGKIIYIPPHFLVRGDILFLKDGDTVPCDAYILEADSLKVYEAAAFEGGGQAFKESRPTDAPEKAYKEMHNVLFATSEILSGSCKAICIATGRYTLAVHQRRVSSLYGDTTPEFFRKIKKRTSPLLYAMSFLCLLILICGFIYGKAQIFNSFFVVAASLSSLMFACTEGICVVGYSLCFDRMRRKKHAKALFKNPLSLDLLPQLDCIFVDTDMMFAPDALTVGAVHTAHNRYTVEELSTLKNDELQHMLSYVSALESCVIAETDTPEASAPSLSPEKTALHRFFAQNPFFIKNTVKTISFRPNGNGFYFDSVLLADDQGGLVVSVGDATSVLRSCANVWDHGAIEPLSEQLRFKLIDDLSLLRKKGRQVLAYAMTRTSETQMAHSSLFHRNMTFLCFVEFQKRESGSLEKFFENCAKRKLEPIVFHNGTAESASLLTEEHTLLQKARICDGKTIPDSCSEYAPLLDSFEIFADFSIEQKYKLFRELIDRKFKVGILANGIDDQPFLKDAHIVFAQASSEQFSKMSNEHAKQAPMLMKESDVLVGHDINALSDAVEATFDCRRNILSSFSYLTGMLALRVLLCLVGAIFGFPLVSMPGLLILNFLWDTIVIYHLLIGSFQKNATPRTFIPDFRHAVKRSINFILPFAISTLCVSIAIPILLFYIPGFTERAMTLAVFWSLVAIGILYAKLSFGIRFSSFTKTRIIPVLIFVSAISALPFISTLFGVSFRWLSLIIAVFITALFALLCAISNIRENKYKK